MLAYSSAQPQLALSAEPLPSDARTAQVDYAVSLFDPFTTAPTYPDGAPDPRNTRAIYYNATLTGATNYMILYTPHSNNVLRVFNSTTDGKWTNPTVIPPSQSLTTDFAKYRSTTGGLRISSATIASGLFSVAGQIYAINARDPFDQINTSSSALVSYAQTDVDVRSNILLADGLCVLAPPNPTGDWNDPRSFYSYGKELVFNSQVRWAIPGGAQTPSTTNLGTVDISRTPGWVANGVIPPSTPTVLYNSSLDNGPGVNNSYIPYGAAGRHTISIRIDGFMNSAVANEVMSVGLTVIDTIAGGGATVLYSQDLTQSRLSVAGQSATSWTGEFTFTTLTPIGGIQLGIGATATASASLFNASIKYTNWDVAVPGRMSNFSQIIITGVNAAQTITVSGVVNYEVIPGFALAKNMKLTQGSGDPRDLFLANQLYLNRAALGLAGVFTNREYEAFLARLRGESMMFNRDQLEKVAHTFGIGDIWRGIKRISKTIAPAVVSNYVPSSFQPAVNAGLRAIGMASSSSTPIAHCAADRKANNPGGEAPIKKPIKKPDGTIYYPISPNATAQLDFARKHGSAVCRQMMRLNAMVAPHAQYSLLITPCGKHIPTTRLFKTHIQNGCQICKGSDFANFRNITCTHCGLSEGTRFLMYKHLREKHNIVPCESKDDDGDSIPAPDVDQMRPPPPIAHCAGVGEEIKREPVRLISSKLLEHGIQITVSINNGDFTRVISKLSDLDFFGADKHDLAQELKSKYPNVALTSSQGADLAAIMAQLAALTKAVSGMVATLPPSERRQAMLPIVSEMQRSMSDANPKYSSLSDGRFFPSTNNQLMVLDKDRIFTFAKTVAREISRGLPPMLEFNDKNGRDEFFINFAFCPSIVNNNPQVLYFVLTDRPFEFVYMTRTPVEYTLEGGVNVSKQFDPENRAFIARMNNQKSRGKYVTILNDIQIAGPSCQGALWCLLNWYPPLFAISATVEYVENKEGKITTEFGPVGYSKEKSEIVNGGGFPFPLLFGSKDPFVIDFQSEAFRKLRKLEPTTYFVHSPNDLALIAISDEENPTLSKIEARRRNQEMSQRGSISNADLVAEMEAAGAPPVMISATRGITRPDSLANAQRSFEQWKASRTESKSSYSTPVSDLAREAYELLSSMSRADLPSNFQGTFMADLKRAVDTGSGRETILKNAEDWYKRRINRERNEATARQNFGTSIQRQAAKKASRGYGGPGKVIQLD